MIVDSSALVAILLREPDGERMLEFMGNAEFAGIGAATMTEAAIVMTAKVGVIGKSLLDRLVREADLTIVAFTDRHWTVAADAFIRFGKGRHPAKLNFGDCLTYATASVLDQPLLCIGDDFIHTDLKIVAT